MFLKKKKKKKNDTAISSASKVHRLLRYSAISEARNRRKLDKSMFTWTSQTMSFSQTNTIVLSLLFTHKYRSLSDAPIRFVRRCFANNREMTNRREFWS